MQFSSADKALYVKIVYYGPGLSGKTTNLETIHRITDPKGRQKMVSLRTQEDRTLFFDLLPFDLGRLYGLTIRVKLYTVPGQIQYDTTRRQVLAGADGVVFVADSQSSQLENNVRMIRYLLNNLQDNGLDARTIPLVFQWNKQDLKELAPNDVLESKLNWRNAPSLPAVATEGDGVIETFREIASLTLRHLAEKAPTLSDKMRSSRIAQDVDAAFAPFLANERARSAEDAPTSAPPARAAPAASTSLRADERDRSVLGLDDLLSEAVQANLEMSSQLVDREASEAIARRERKALMRLVQISGLSTEAEAILKMALTAGLSGLDLSQGAVLVRTKPGAPLRTVALCGMQRDPLNAIETPGIGSVAAGLLDRQAPYVTRDVVGELLFGQSTPETATLRGVLAAPIGPGRPADALIFAYADAQAQDPTPEGLEFLQLVASIASLALRSVRRPSSAPSRAVTPPARS
jgi:signal recognition particle receptor subunit beta